MLVAVADGDELVAPVQPPDEGAGSLAAERPVGEEGAAIAGEHDDAVEFRGREALVGLEDRPAGHLDRIGLLPRAVARRHGRERGNGSRLLAGQEACEVDAVDGHLEERVAVVRFLIGMAVRRRLEGRAARDEKRLQGADLALLKQAAHGLVRRQGAEGLVEGEHDARVPARLGKGGGDAAAGGDRAVAKDMPPLGRRRLDIVPAAIPGGADIGKADTRILQRPPGVDGDAGDFHVLREMRGILPVAADDPQRPVARRADCRDHVLGRDRAGAHDRPPGLSCRMHRGSSSSSPGDCLRAPSATTSQIIEVISDMK